MLTITTPPIVRLNSLSATEEETARDFLTFHDKGVDYLIAKHKQKRYWQRNDPEGWQEQFENLKAQRKRCILFEDKNGFFTYAGLAKSLQQELRCSDPLNKVCYPDPVGVAWATDPEHEQRYYQEDMKRLLLEAKHGGVEVGTGLGKSRVILELARYLGLQTLVVAPSTSIATQLMADFERYLGRRNVGMYGDGKKKTDKLVTIALYQSLCRLSPGDPAWEDLKSVDVFMVDESHTCPASTLEKVCMGLARNAAYRFFFSATQVRGDGSELVLQGITGPIVYRMSVQEGVDQGFLAKPCFKMMNVVSCDSYDSDDVQKMTQRHLYYNPEVLKKAAGVINGVVKHLDHSVLVLVDELPQFAALQPLLRHEARFAHGGVTKENQGKLPKEYHKSDPQALVEQFNRREFPVLVGTSCISTGTDIKACETVVFLMGGKSPILVPQAVGRGTRRWKGFGRDKTAFNFVDFALAIRNGRYNDGATRGGIALSQEDKRGMSPVFRHCLNRAQMYRDLYPNIEWV